MSKANVVFSIAHVGDEQDAPASQMVRERAQEVLRAVMAKRFREARNMNGLGQHEAALRIGWSNPTQLSLIEDGRATRPCPLWALANASDVYGVSVDYLMGRSDEPERDPRLAERQALVRNTHHAMMTYAQMMVNQIHAYTTKGAPAVVTARRLLAESESMAEAVDRFHQLNREAFLDLKAGSTLLRRLEGLQAAVMEVKSMLDRYDRMTESTLREAAERAGRQYPLIDNLHN